MKKNYLFFVIILFIFISVKNIYSMNKNINVPLINLNNGYKMPILGFGTWTLNDKEAENIVYLAIKNGYRLIDTANYYGNEVGVGKGIKKAIKEGICSRKDIFITTKIIPYYTDNYDNIIKETNKKLNLEYIDLLLIHQQGSTDKQLYKTIEKAIDLGIVKSLGISNYYTLKDYNRITKDSKILPVIIQNENHIFYQNKELKEYVKKDNIFIESYYPLGGRGNTSKLLNNKLIKDLSKKYNKTPAQIILRWHTQSNYIPIPGTSNLEHLKENIDIFDFSLTNEELNLISNLDINERYENW